MNNLKILAIVPAYNEVESIAKTVAEIRSLPFSISILVVDDGSGDATALAARSAGAWVVSLPFNLGIGGAVQTGFQFAREKGFDIAVQIDGDGQHDVGYLQKILEPVRRDQAELVIGSRFLPPYLGYQSSVIRRLGIHFFSGLISWLIRAPITDPTSGFRAYSRRLIDIFADHYPHDYPEPEAIVVARQANARIMEVPVQMRKREAGSSSIRYFFTLYYMIKVTSAILLDMIKKKRIANSG